MKLLILRAFDSAIEYKKQSGERLMEHVNQFLLGDCEKILKKLPDNSIDLIFTSPPYADQRKRTYGGVSPDEYVKWFMPKADQFFRVLKPTETFILNIKERVVNGERHTYVIELIIEMKKRGWLWIVEILTQKTLLFELPTKESE